MACKEDHNICTLRNEIVEAAAGSYYLMTSSVDMQIVVVEVGSSSASLTTAGCSVFSPYSVLFHSHSNLCVAYPSNGE